MLNLCQHGYEAFLERELVAAGVAATEKGSGWVLAEPGRASPPDEPLHGTPGSSGGFALPEPDLAFAHLTLLAPREFRGDSVNEVARQLAEYFLESLRGERIEAAWPCWFATVAEVPGLGRRAGGVEKAFGELLRRKLARVARLATPDLPRGPGRGRGLYVYFADFGRVFAAREAVRGGQRRMADDDAAPSRSYLKVEEAYALGGREPVAGETVVDLGAAPGGWSYSAAKRGARVVAVDNGPLKGGALGHPLIEHVQADAFGYQPVTGCDWLFCDLVEEPHHVLKDLVSPWLAQRWCRRFVINLKFGHVDPLALLRELRADGSPFARHGRDWRIRHLYHDREEFTVVGETA
jgi:23S rRNA (cytidine2498-2'-O)-methyltransferase